MSRSNSNRRQGFPSQKSSAKSTSLWRRGNPCAAANPGFPLYFSTRDCSRFTSGSSRCSSSSTWFYWVWPSLGTFPTAGVGRRRSPSTTCSSSRCAGANSSFGLSFGSPSRPWEARGCLSGRRRPPPRSSSASAESTAAAASPPWRGSSTPSCLPSKTAKTPLPKS